MFVSAKGMAENGVKETDSLLAAYKQLESLEKEGKKEEAMEYKDMVNLCYKIRKDLLQLREIYHSVQTVVTDIEKLDKFGERVHIFVLHVL